jgi:hypothetical protein
MRNDGKIHLTITCAICGEPLIKTSAKYGMDCKNDCNKKAYEIGPRRCATKTVKTAPNAMVDAKKQYINKEPRP